MALQTLPPISTAIIKITWKILPKTPVSKHNLQSIKGKLQTFCSETDLGNPRRLNLLWIVCLYCDASWAGNTIAHMLIPAFVGGWTQEGFSEVLAVDHGKTFTDVSRTQLHFKIYRVGLFSPLSIGFQHSFGAYLLLPSHICDAKCAFKSKVLFGDARSHEIRGGLSHSSKVSRWCLGDSRYSRWGNWLLTVENAPNLLNWELASAPRVLAGEIRGELRFGISQEVAIWEWGRSSSKIRTALHLKHPKLSSHHQKILFYRA